jgi:AcrR family transcriptional regulator
VARVGGYFLRVAGYEDVPLWHSVRWKSMSVSREREVVEDFEARVREFLAPRLPDVSDGRVAIRVRNRDKVIDTLIELITEGKAGTVEEIVERSGVARRTIFRHFTDLSDLLLEGLRRVVSDAAPLAILKNLGVGSLDERIEAFVDVRLRTLDQTHIFRLVANSRLADLEAVRTGIRVTAEMVRNQIAAQFAKELAGRTAAEAEGVIDLIYLVGSFEGYDVSINQLGRPVEVVRANWIFALSQILKP